MFSSEYCEIFKNSFFIEYLWWLLLTAFSENCIKVKVELNFYCHTSLWWQKRFYEGLEGLHKTFRGTTKKCENKNVT